MPRLGTYLPKLTAQARFKPIAPQISQLFQ